MPPGGEQDQPNGLLGPGGNGGPLADAQAATAAAQQTIPLGRCRSDPFTGQPLVRHGPRQLDLPMSMNEYYDHMIKGPQYLSVISKPVVMSLPSASGEESDELNDTSYGAFLHYDRLT
jgi:hypothetical protein